MEKRGKRMDCKLAMGKHHQNHILLAKYVHTYTKNMVLVTRLINKRHYTNKVHMINSEKNKRV